MFTQGYTNTQDHNSAALSLFWRSVHKGWIYRQLARLGGKVANLRDFSADTRCRSFARSGYSGTRTVSIDEICGTEEKPGVFDNRFYPTSEESRSRWMNVARERLDGSSLPPVDLIELDGCYYVRDGHHRISVARSLGEHFVDAEIITIHLGQVSQACLD
jgi:hypothetical protein